jgi:hypothetical protein
MRRLALSILVLLAGCDPAEIPEDDQPGQPPSSQAFVQPEPPAPEIPVVKRAQVRASPSISERREVQVQASRPPDPRPDPQQAQQQEQAELLAKYQAIYAEYAAWVARLEQSTAHIPAKDTRHRRQFYWIPLEKFGQQLQTQHQVTGYQLAQVVNQGQQENWPTQNTKDGAAVARMFRRIPAELAVAYRRAEARANLAALDALCDSIVAQATAAGSSGGQIGVFQGPGGGAVLPPIFTGPGGWRSFVHGRVRFGQPSY